MVLIDDDLGVPMASSSSNVVLSSLVNIWRVVCVVDGDGNSNRVGKIEGWRGSRVVCAIISDLDDDCVGTRRLMVKPISLFLIVHRFQ